MERYTAVLFIVFFLAFIPITFKVLMALEINLLFKQGKVMEIRLAYIGLSLILSYFLSSSIVGVIERLYSIFY
jgi:uncharacterized membrane protein YwzB